MATDSGGFLVPGSDRTGPRLASYKCFAIIRLRAIWRLAMGGLGDRHVQVETPRLMPLETLKSLMNESGMKGSDGW